MTRLVVDFAALEGLGAAIERTVTDTEEILADLSDQVDRLGELWAGRRR